MKPKFKTSKVNFEGKIHFFTFHASEQALVNEYGSGFGILTRIKIKHGILPRRKIPYYSGTTADQIKYMMTERVKDLIGWEKGTDIWDQRRISVIFLQGA